MSSILELVGALCSNDNNVRRQAEQVFNDTKQNNPMQLVASLTELIMTSGQEQIRALSAVLLRRLFEVKSGIWQALDAASQASSKQSLLAAIQKEPKAHVVIHKTKDFSSWPELLPFVASLFQSTENQSRENALDMINKLAEYIGPALLPHVQTLHSMINAGLTDSSGEVQVAALKATTSILVMLDEPEQRAPFIPMVPQLLRVLQAVLNADELIARDVLTALIDVAELQPTFLRSSLDQVGQAMLAITASDDLDADTRQLAAEFLLGLCENAGGMVRKCKWLVDALLPLGVQLLCEVDDDAEWQTKIDSANVEDMLDDGDELEEVGARVIDGLAKALGGKAVLPVAFNVCQAYLGDSAWQKRRAGVLTMALLGEGCGPIMRKELPRIVPGVVNFLSDPHIRVRGAALHCVGQMALDFGQAEDLTSARLGKKSKSFQMLFHSSVVPALVQSIGELNAAAPRVQTMAVTAMINFCDEDGCNSACLAPYLQPLLETLFGSLQSGAMAMQEQALTAVARIAAVTKEAFLPYYATFMPMFKSILNQAQGDDYALLRGKAMESIAIVGEAVGAEVFAADAQATLQMLLKLQQDSFDATKGEFRSVMDDASGMYVVQSCARIGRVLGPAFGPYLHLVIPQLLQQTQIEADFILEDADAGPVEEQAGLEMVTVNIRGVGEKRIGVNSTALEEKNLAVQMLYQYVTDMGTALYAPTNFLKPIATALIPMLTFRYMEAIRIAAAAGMPKLLQILLDANTEGAAPEAEVAELFWVVLQALVPALVQEFEQGDIEVMGVFAEQLADVLKMSRENCDRLPSLRMTLEQAQGILAALHKITVQSIVRRQTRFEKAQASEDFDEEAQLQLEEEECWEEDVMGSLIDAFGWVIKQHGEAIYPTVSQLILPVVQQMLGPDSSTSIGRFRSAAICFVDDLFEHCSPSSHALIPSMWPILLQGLSNDFEGVRQAAAYGIGVCAEHCKAPISPMLPQALQGLQMLISQEDAWQEENESATDNAVSAVSKICEFCGDLVDVAQILPAWLSWLPLSGDILEARLVHAQLGRFVERGLSGGQGNPFAAIASAEVLPLVFAVFAKAHQGIDLDEEMAEDAEEYDLLDNATRMQIKAILAHVQTSMGDQALTAIMQATRVEYHPLLKELREWSADS